ncbi:hypothetical protein D9V96_006780 [Zobellia laminariae]|uniref:hypothetical protein n=1 Tax=Zobellia laminariae TaxID=248906 RepID=UPI0012D89A63|nr:hypothetical protein [Zobellia laminariae]MUH39370.1 hypothetical protein [Zobellia laminariae]WKX78104.1 hypothetical protein Q5W13_09385 [Zobellia laminariae]
MKTTIVLLVALTVNTSLIFSESLFTLVKYIHPLLLLGVEVLLLMLFACHKIWRDFSKTMEIDFGGLEVFTYRKKRK